MKKTSWKDKISYTAGRATRKIENNKILVMKLPLFTKDINVATKRAQWVFDELLPHILEISGIKFMFYEPLPIISISDHKYILILEPIFPWMDKILNQIVGAMIQMKMIKSSGFDISLITIDYETAVKRKAWVAENIISIVHKEYDMLLEIPENGLNLDSSSDYRLTLMKIINDI